MSGASGNKGYLLQSFISVLDSLSDNEWISIQVEIIGYDKVDILWHYANGRRKVTQVKHSSNQITKSNVTQWAEELKQDYPDGDSYEIRLLGPINKDVDKIKIDKVQIPTPETINTKSLIEQASNLLDKFLENNTIVNLPSFAREIVIRDLISEFSILSTGDTAIDRPKYLKQLKEKVLIFLPKAITEATEELKMRYESISRIEEKKFELKYEACMEALEIIDEYFKIQTKQAHSDMFLQINKQYNTDYDSSLIQLSNPIELRDRILKCHNKLVLACDNIETIRAFRICLVVEKNKEGKNTMGDIVDLRIAIRKELNFGNENTDSDKDKAWLGFIYP